ncbi:MAG: 2-haloacid dehalogenase [Acidimicrobiales bacterium]
MRYHHVLLDLDHTLLDTDTSLQMAFDDAMFAVGTDPSGVYPIFDEINHALWRRVEAQELTPPQVHVERFVQLNERLELGVDPQRMADAFAQGMGEHGELYPGARKVLDDLAEIATLALITNGLSGIQRARIERLGIHDHFAAITISAEVGAAKPGTEIFDVTFKALGAPDQSGALMVGDNLGSDIAGGNNAGIDTCWYNPTGKPASAKHLATHTISSLEALLRIVTGL